MIVVDTGPLIAAAIADDRHHARCVEMFTRAIRDRRTLIVPAFVAAETCFMLARDGGPATESAFLRSLGANSPFVMEALQPEDLGRMAELVSQYADLPLGAVDASVVAVAERLRVAEVATIDVRHFHIVRPRHRPTFTLLPN